MTNITLYEKLMRDVLESEDKLTAEQVLKLILLLISKVQ